MATKRVARAAALALCALAAPACDRGASPDEKGGAKSRAAMTGTAPRSEAGTSPAAAAAVGAPAEEPVKGAFHFTDITAGSGLDSFRQVNGSAEKPIIIETIGIGAALFDADQDGRLDAYLTNGGRLEKDAPKVKDALFRARGDGTFEDATERYGLGDEHWTMGAYACDLDADGQSDLFLTNWGPDVLYRRGRDGRFEDVSARAGIADPRWGTGAAFLDYDRDGDLDLYVANYVALDPGALPTQMLEYRGVEVAFGPRGLKPEPHFFYENRGDCTFEERSSAVGIGGSTAFGFQVVAFDYDEDAYCDLYVGNDSMANFLWHNERGTGFRSVGLESGAALSKAGMEQASMGVAVGDCTGDGLFDLFVTNFSEDYHTLYRNDGGGFFRDVTVAAQLVLPTLDTLGWGCGMLDLDSDGDLDLVMANSHVYPQIDRFDFGTRYRQRNQIFENIAPGRFREATLEAGTGFRDAGTGRGMAWGDVDDDGDLDLLFANLDGPPKLLRNDTRGGRSAKLRLVGAGANRDAAGAVVRVTAGGRTQTFCTGDSSSFLSSHDPRPHIGLGAAETIEKLEVRWPDGTRESFESLPAGALITIVQGEGAAQTSTLR